MAKTTTGLWLLLAAGSLTLAASVARAAPEEAPTATDLFAEGKSLAAAGDFARACPKFERSLSLEHGIGTQFNLADCWERVGRTASAYRSFSEVAQRTRDLGQTDRHELAQRRADALRPKLSRLTLEVKAPVEGLQIRRNRELVATESVGSPIAVDPGTHEVEVTAPGKQPWTVAIEVPAGPATLSLSIPTLKDAPARKPATVSPPLVRETKPSTRQPPPSSVARDVETRSEPAESIDGGSGFGRTAAWGLAGLGVIGVAGGVVMGLEFRSNDDEARSICPSGRDCTNEQILRHNELVDAANRARTWAFVSGGVGGALLIGATILWLTSGDTSSNTAWVATPILTADGSAGLVVSGRY